MTTNLNVELLNKVADAILAEPRQFIMATWFSKSGGTGTGWQLSPETRDIPREIPNCGTAACIAGHVIAVFEGVNPARAHAMNFTYIKSRAADLLHITGDEAERLFFVANWTNDFREAWEEAVTVEARAQVAYDRIQYFIENGA